MDTYEDQELEMTPDEPQQLEQEHVQPEQSTDAEQNQTFSAQPSGFYGYGGEGVYQQTPQASPVEKPRMKKERKWLKRCVAAVLVVALVIGACCITAAIQNASWSQFLAGEMAYLQQKIDMLQNELNAAGNLGGEIVVSPVEGMTPAQVYQQNVKSVVNIACQTVTNNGGQSYVSTSSGSGFILTEDGYIVTNHHVIQGSSSITVIAWDNTEYTATLIGSDASNDIALLKIMALGLQKVTIGSSDNLAVGSQVVAIGNALGELTSSLTVGYISGKDRDITTDGTIINMLQTDAVINPGNSGGPLFNMKGEVIGINTAKYSGSTGSGASIEGIGFAIPIDDVIGMLEDLRDYGYITGVQMGVMVRNMDPTVVEQYGFPMGVYVQSVVDGSCAQAAGIRAKDVIVDVGGYEIETMNDLTRALRKFKAGDTAIVSVWRGGQVVRLTIVFDAKNAA